MTSEELENNIDLLEKITRKMENGSMNVFEAMISVRDEYKKELDSRPKYW